MHNRKTDNNYIFKICWLQHIILAYMIISATINIFIAFHSRNLNQIKSTATLVPKQLIICSHRSVDPNENNEHTPFAHFDVIARAKPAAGSIHLIYYIRWIYIRGARMRRHLYSLYVWFVCLSMCRVFFLVQIKQSCSRVSGVCHRCSNSAIACFFLCV